MSDTESALLNELVVALKCLPSVGARTAQRMAFHLLEHDREKGLKLAVAMQNAIENIGHCTLCRTLTEHAICRICSDKSRSDETLNFKVLYDSDLIVNLEEKQKENTMDTERLAQIIDKSFMTDSGRQTAREVLLK